MKHFYLCLALCLCMGHWLTAQQLDMSKIEEGMLPRSIGPAGMSGRVTAIDVVTQNPDIIYIGSASGGLWKSEGGGTHWQPIFDEQPVASIGAIAIYQKNPDIIYVGSGEGNPRNSQSAGNGMYKTLDGGKTWKHLGLEDSRNIHRVFVHPDNPDIVYAGVQGAAWEDTETRGVYKSTDGGESWKRILYVNSRTGVGDMVMDPNNPEKLMVGMWEFRRWPWFFKSGGPGSGLYVSYDGGKNWEKRTDKDGLPKGEIGKIGLAIAPGNSKVVYAFVESEKNAIFRSEDGGKNWKQTATENIGSRPFYYADLAVDPHNENRLYSIASSVRISEDGGKTFEVLLGFDKIHVDHHAWYIHPDNPGFMIDGNDGGLAITRDRGESWRFIENLPLDQFYHINYDMEVPYNVMGGMQDNGSWRGPAYTWRAGGIRNGYWEEVAFGDGFDVVPDSSNARYLYAMWQGGNLQRVDLETGNSQYIKPAHPQADVFLRFNWDAAIAHDPFDERTIYYGSQFLHKSTDRGEHWEIISPDLTTNDSSKQKQLESGGLTLDATQAENHTTITSIAPSLAHKDIIWVGTDDGNVQLTRDGGNNWENVVSRIKDLPKNTWVHQIHASKYDAAEAFVVFDDHRRNNWTPYVYHTNNYGKSWTRLVNEEDADAFALSIVQDPVEPKLLFLGTETGLYVSIDKGESWTKWGKNYPHVPTMDLKIHPREHDLIIGTFGRAAYILDDIRPLRALAQEGADLLEENLHVFEAPTAYQALYKQAAGTRFQGDAIYEGKNRPFGANITFSLKEITKKEKDSTRAEKDSVLVEVLNTEDEVIRTFRAEAQAGLNRLNWDLYSKGVRDPDTPKPNDKNADEPAGFPVLPGEYTVRITYGDWQDATTVKVLLDPRIQLSDTELMARQQMSEEYMRYMQMATQAVDQLNEAKSSIQLINQQLSEREDDAAQQLKEMARSLQDSIKMYKELIAQKEDVQGILRDPHIVSGKLGAAGNYLGAFWNASNETQRRVLSHLKISLQEPIETVNSFFTGPWIEYQDKVEAAELSFFKDYEPIRLE